MLRVVLLFLTAALATAAAQPGSKNATKPNILFIVADDLGWNDVGWHNPDVKTPVLDQLANEGVILNQCYVNYVCTPSRTAFMTGYFPYHVGSQHTVFFPQQAQGIPSKFPFLPEKLKQLGYATHMVGKDDKDVVKTRSGQYGTYFFTDRVVDIVEKHPADTPLFMYLPYQNVHQPLQVPQRFEDMYASVQDENRRKLLGMVSALDEAVGNVTMAMKKAGLWDNTLVIFTTDNGGWISASGNNYPLRGGKVTLWEGGTRGVAFAHGKMLQKTGYTNNEMIHAVDWFPTILAAAGGTADEAIDGVSQLDTIMSGQPSPRTEFVYNIDDEFPTKQGAIRVGDYKLIEGYAGKPDGWILPPNLTGSQLDSGDPVIGTWLFNLKVSGDPVIGTWLFNLKAGQRRPRHRDLALQPESQPDSGDPVIGTWLFNLKDDPTEHHNLADSMPDKLREMQAKLAEYRKSLVPAIFPAPDPKSNPDNWGGAWSPGWC
uniref:Sulfatase N-terminal domain-containing protein n=1 Tax=Branchiostoma floridae TaxID=7739 RepID=C3YF72_BRAFL|eukprot:XP_002605064.1 hypothetical protein BRAFLDRAFT_124136 [Branchiostoma floridae]